MFFCLLGWSWDWWLGFLVRPPLAGCFQGDSSLRSHWSSWIPLLTPICNTGVGGVFLPISKAIAILSSEQLQGCSLLSLLFLSREPYLHLQVSATTLSNERPDNTEPKSSKQTLTCINLSNHSTLFGHTSFLANQLLRRHLVMIMR